MSPELLLFLGLALPVAWVGFVGGWLLQRAMAQRRARALRGAPVGGQSLAERAPDWQRAAWGGAGFIEAATQQDRIALLESLCRDWSHSVPVLLVARPDSIEALGSSLAEYSGVCFLEGPPPTVAELLAAADGYHHGEGPLVLLESIDALAPQQPDAMNQLAGRCPPRLSVWLLRTPEEPEPHGLEALGPELEPRARPPRWLQHLLHPFSRPPTRAQLAAQLGLMVVVALSAQALSSWYLARHDSTVETAKVVQTMLEHAQRGK